MSGDGSYTDALKGRVSAEGLRVAVIVARFNGDITERLLQGALACLRDHGSDDSRVDVYRVPGAFELPPAAARVVAAGRHDAIVTLGCVIRGGTPHFEYVSGETTRGIGAVARDAGIPVTFGVLTTDDHDQALARVPDGPANKGYEAALSALEMVASFRAIREGH
ncbi:MAG: 6,7-dimethyl-8-ribityllumazine synthase [Gemmatimonadota bacterium]|nr:6,7-dimethyl-8-ribityllumazine synthase [Gemmatimonadota bacterium]